MEQCFKWSSNCSVCELF